MRTVKSRRTWYSVKNAGVAMAAKILAIFFGYLARVVFARTLSMEYLGIQGLYTNIIGALNVMDLGIGTALVYSMYGPAAENNTRKQRALMKLYDRIYLVSALIVALIGIIMYPVLMLLMKDTGSVGNIMIIYAVFLFSNCMSYVLIYRSMIFIANQRNYVNDMFDSLFLVLQNCIQIVILLLTGNYYLYLSVYIFAVLGRNYAIYTRAGKEYPEVFLPAEVEVTKEESDELFRNVRAMLMHKVGNVIIRNIDNLTLTGIVGLTAVGMYSNYYLIAGSVRQVIERIVYGIAGPVGNLGATEDEEHVRNVFLAVFFLVAAGYGTAAVTLYHVLDLFVKISFGQEYVFPRAVTAVLCINFFLNGLRQASLIFRDSLGLFWHDRYKTIAESLLNLGASVILALKYGAAGVFIGTTVSIVCISMWVEPLVLYRQYFHRAPREYFFRLVKYCALFGVSWITAAFLRDNIPWQDDFMKLAGMAVISPAVSLLVIILCCFRSDEFSFVRSHLIQAKEGEV